MRGIVHPIAVWGRKAPSHSICALMLTDDQQTVVTGSQEGQICLWNLSPDFKTQPRILLFGHVSSVTCFAKASEKQPYVVSAAENGEMCLWNVTNGQCLENTVLPFTHTAICYYYRSFRMSGDGWLLCCGQYQDVLVVDARTLEVLHALISSVTPDWISSMCIVCSQRIQEDSLVGISVTGDLKVWDLSSSVNGVQERQNIFEAESKSLQCFNCRTICFCTFTERLLLVVCSDYWKVFDYCDFSLLCSACSGVGQRWAGGDVLGANKIIIWTEDGRGYIYQLPDRWGQMGKPHEKFSNLFKSGIFTDAHSLTEPGSPRLLCVTSDDVNSKAVLIFINERKEPFYKILFRGEASGKLSMWHIPDVPMARFDGSPQEIQTAATLSLQEAFEQPKFVSEELIDQLGVLPDRIQTSLITTSVYVANHDKLACGCEDGRIIITLGLHAARAQLLAEHSLLKAWLPHRILVGHHGRVTCLLYPYTKSARFDPSWLVSGGEDSSVMWWNMFKAELLHSFALHAGPVLNLFVCPEDCNPEVQQSICCLANDNSVALLSLQCRTSLIHARKHLSPVRTIKWRPGEDLMVVGCDDGSVYVWDIETGALDRHETGNTAKSILSLCEYSPASSVHTPESLSAGARPFDPTKKKAANARQCSRFGVPPPPLQAEDTSKYSEKFAFSVLPVKTKWTDSAIHVLLFDVDAICKQLLSHQEQGPKGQSSSHGSSEVLRRITNADGKKPPPALKRSKPAPVCQANGPVKDLVQEHLFCNEGNASALASESVNVSKQKIKPKGAKKTKPPVVKKMDINMTTDTAKLLISCLFPWGVDRDLDELCVKHLGLFEPRCPVSFGLVSQDDYLSLLLPGWHQVNREAPKEYSMCNKISSKVEELARQVLNMTRMCVVLPAEETLSKADGNFQPEATSYLLSVILLVNIQMRMPFLSKGNERHNNTVRQQLIDSLRGKGVEISQSAIPAFSAEGFHSRTFSPFWGLSKEKSFDVLTNLVASWQAQSVELLEAVQALLLSEIQRVLRATRKPSITNGQDVIKGQNGNSETKTSVKIEPSELQVTQKTPGIVMPASVNVVLRESQAVAKEREAEDRPDRCACEKSDSPEGDDHFLRWNRMLWRISKPRSLHFHLRQRITFRNWNEGRPFLNHQTSSSRLAGGRGGSGGNDGLSPSEAQVLEVKWKARHITSPITFTASNATKWKSAGGRVKASDPVL
ncbi:WD repeat-containing protein 72 [Callorhinchus milii]|uniref:WD repeat-containing protein 72 n=1 Tax=Callorhinchus milii TaxID=7868 RepID=UPI001C3F6352|nr:WD repeat-containing protein 72 [Callorhinchus milii]